MEYKLAPPLLNGTIPAFYSNDQGIVITIPFSMNRVVGIDMVDGFQIKIKSSQSSTQLYSIYVDKNMGMIDNAIQVIIRKDSLDYKKFKVGQFYKIQIAYVNGKTVGYFSSVAIAKYTTAPLLSIHNLIENTLNSHTYTYTGLYDQSGTRDRSERIYSYKFNLYGSGGDLIATSGELLHDTTKDDIETPGQTEDTYTFAQDLEIGQFYRVEYIVTTMNGLTMASPRYRIAQKQSISAELNATLLATLDYDNGYVSLDLRAGDNSELSSGFFIVSRACETSNYTIWEEVARFTLVAQVANQHICKDFTVEQGKHYIYGIQQYNSNNLRSSRITSQRLFVDFEDAFLFDGKRQLKIKYNPKVSSFKKDLLEQKTDTVGGKYPFIFRNGRVYYSEFPISGLVSYQMDEENLFLSEEEYGLTEKTTNLTAENMAAERTFKMKVLEWLTNGEPKVFRSPAEGNYIVRLMNSSMSPTDTVGRMLHTFSCTAYEVAEFNYETLGEMGFITIEDQNIASLQWETIEFTYKYSDTNGNIVVEQRPIQTNLLKYPARTLRFDNMMPGDVVYITFSNGTTENVKIGITGSYYIDTGVHIKEVSLQRPSQGSMTYSYNYVKEPVFNNISDVEILEIAQQQFIGEHDILKEITCVYDSTRDSWVKNPKVEIINVYQLDIAKRPLQRFDINLKDICEDIFLIYELGNLEPDLTTAVSPTRRDEIFTFGEYWDAYNRESSSEYEPLVKLNGTIISVDEKELIKYTKPGKLNELISGNGTLVNIAYQLGVITYKLEKECESATPDHYLYNLKLARADYLRAKNNLNNVWNDNVSEANLNQYLADIQTYRQDLSETYNTYIIELVKAQEEDSRRKGEIV